MTSLTPSETLFHRKRNQSAGRIGDSLSLPEIGRAWIPAQAGDVEPRLIPTAISALHLILLLKMQKGKMLEGILVGPGSAEFHITDPPGLWRPFQTCTLASLFVD